VLWRAFSESSLVPSRQKQTGRPARSVRVILGGRGGFYYPPVTKDVTWQA